MIILGLLGILVLLSFGVIAFIGAPYVPTHQREIERALSELYPVSREDVVVDIGSGDGRVLRLAAEHGARAVGYELNPFLVVISRWLSRAHVDQIEVRLADAWTAALPEATTLVYVFAVSRDLPRLLRKLRRHVAKTGRPLWLMCYGSQPADLTAEAMKGAHGLYRIDALQSDEA